MKENNNDEKKNQNLNEDDFNISITNEVNEQELTSMGETGKSSGIISAINFAHSNISYSNIKRIFCKKLEPMNQIEETNSMYTNAKKVRNNNSIFNDDMYTEVSKKQIYFHIIFSIENFYNYWIKKKKKKRKCTNYIMKKWKNVII